jgi:hypothetical protein
MEPESEMFLFSATFGSGAHLASYPMATFGSFPGVKCPGREANHTFLSSAVVMIVEAIPPLPHTSS